MVRPDEASGPINVHLQLRQMCKDKWVINSVFKDALLRPWQP